MSDRLKANLPTLLGLVGALALVIFSLPYMISSYYSWQGDELKKNGQFTDAADAYQKALDVKPSTGTLEKLGSTYEDSKQPEQAIAALQKAVDLSPSDSLAHYDLGVQLMKSGDLPHARQQLTQAVNLDEHNSKAHLALSSLAQQLGDKRLAIHELQAAVESGANGPDAHLRMGEIYLAKLDPRAEQEFRKALASDPGSAAAHLHLGCLLLDRDPDEANEHLQKAAAGTTLSVDDRVRAFSGLALIACRQNNVDAASRYLQQAADLHPGEVMRAAIHYQLGVVRHQSGDRVGAEQAFSEAAQEQPLAADFRSGAMVGRLALYGDALSAERDGRTSDAERDWRTLITLYPHQAVYREHLAGLLLIQNDVPGAISHLRLAAGLAPSDPDIWMRLAEALLQSGDGAASAAAMGRALRLAPLWPRLRPEVDLLMGKIHLACNRPQEAVSCFRFAAASNSPSVNPQECMALLQTASQRAQQMAISSMPPPVVSAVTPSAALTAPQNGFRRPHSRSSAGSTFSQTLH